MSYNLKAAVAKLMAVRAARDASAAVDAEAVQHMTPAELDLLASWAMYEAAKAADQLDQVAWAGHLLPGACRRIHDTTGDELAGIYANAFEALGYAGAKAEGFELVELTAAKWLMQGPGGFAPPPADAAARSLAYLEGLPGYKPPAPPAPPPAPIEPPVHDITAEIDARAAEREQAQFEAHRNFNLR